MASNLRVLMVEDSEEDCLLTLRQLHRAGYQTQCARVDTAEAMSAELSSSTPEIVICDYDLPRFSAPEALRILHERGLDIPFIVVSGKVGEETAVRMMTSGAHDYIMKSNLTRLSGAVRRELHEAFIRGERAHAEAALREARADLERAQEVAGLGSWVERMDASQSMIWSKQTCRLLGVEPESCQANATSFYSFIHPDDRDQVTEARESAIQRTGAYSLDHRLLLLDGSVGWVHQEAVVERDPAGKVRRIVGTLLDITERKQMEELRAQAIALEEQRRRADEASQFKSKFVANMSHEFRTPLSAIIGFSDLLDQELLGPLLPRQKESVQNICNSSAHLLNLVNDVLDIAKVEAGQMELTRCWQSLPPLIQSVQATLQALARKKGVLLETSIPATLPDAYIDPVRIKQVLYNLLANGIKFTSSGGQVRLVARCEGRNLRLVVEDSGIGIARENISKLFRPFGQIPEAQLGQERQGTGLGLALTRVLVELHGGSIGAEGELGKGAVFSVSLPVLRSLRKTSSVAPMDGVTSVLVLVVNKAQSNPLHSELRELGLAVAHASDPEMALQLATELQPAAIVLDLQLPRIDDRWAMLARLKENPPTAEIPLVVLCEEDEPNRALYLGAIDYLTKPVSRERLKQSLEAVGVPFASEPVTCADRRAS